MSNDTSTQRPQSAPLARREAAQMAAPGDFGAEHMRIVREAFAAGASQTEFEVMWAGAKARGLDPVKKQIYFIKRYDMQRQCEVWASQVSIDGFRSIAASSSLYDGQDEPEYEYDAQGRMLLARVRVYRKGVSRPFVGVARWAEYVQTKKGGDPTHMWTKMEHTMLGKCAEALGLRKAFPELLGGLHSPDEMAQAENPEPPKARTPAPPQLSPGLAAKALLERIPRAEDSAAVFEIIKAAPGWPKVRAHAWMRLLALSGDATEVEQTRALFEADELPAEILAKLVDAAEARNAEVTGPQDDGASAQPQRRPS